MRYRDQPTIEVTQRVRCDVGTAWTCVTEIDLPAQCSTELQAVDWLGDTDGVTVGARSLAAVAMTRSATGRPCARSSKSKTNAAGVWNVIGPDGVGATWGLRWNRPATAC